MRFFRKTAIFINMILMLFVGLVALAIAVKALPAETASKALGRVYASAELQAAAGVFGAFFILTGLWGTLRSLKKLKKSKLITFRNPDGEVTVSVSAIEGYVLRVAREIPGIKDVKSNVSVNKKGINIKSYVSMVAGTNIPEATEMIQMTVKSKVQDMLGVEEKINISMHINKILKGPEGVPAQTPPEEEEIEEPSGERAVPYREM
ncbi:MAG: alkaline shock response membrane anchor protein AmaP [Candidatus Omnitrophica bacterium]|nr:alkaline shock response membrane anchor protein AmaP [Candidatus Omnitrophota bacterium]